MMEIIFIPGQNYMGTFTVEDLSQIPALSITTCCDSSACPCPSKDFFFVGAWDSQTGGNFHNFVFVTTEY